MNSSKLKRNDLIARKHEKSKTANEQSTPHCCETHAPIILRVCDHAIEACHARQNKTSANGAKECAHDSTPERAINTDSRDGQSQAEDSAEGEGKDHGLAPGRCV